ncbi:MAG: hypothetical protein OQK95_01085 [Gammaproteobacteria bacterium]|nr:hypothetical protein [Gammaproteobacteria bacterium]
MSVEDVIAQLDSHSEVLESHVLLREIKMELDIGEYQPLIKIKIYKSSLVKGNPYHFEVSHHVHTPEQMSPYFPSRTSFSSEKEAIDKAITSTTSCLKDAINKGHNPEDEWLIENENF